MSLPGLRILQRKHNIKDHEFASGCANVLEKLLLCSVSDYTFFQIHEKIKHHSEQMQIFQTAISSDHRISEFHNA